MKALIRQIRSFLHNPQEQPAHLRKGELGEEAAEHYLRQRGLKLLARNFTSDRGEIDRIFREGQCMVFVEVKTRSNENWSRPAAAVDSRKRKLICQTAMDYLKQLQFPKCKLRFDIVEVLLNEKEQVDQLRHLSNAFEMPEPYRY